MNILLHVKFLNTSKSVNRVLIHEHIATCKVFKHFEKCEYMTL